MQKSCRAIMKMDNSRSPHSVLKLRIPFGNCIDKICFVLYIMLSKLHLFLNTVWHNLEVLSPESTPKLCQSNIVQNLFLKIMNISHVQKHTICVNGHQKIEILPKSHPKWPKIAKSVLSKIIIDWMLLLKKSYFFSSFWMPKISIFWMRFLWRDHCAPWLLKKKVTIIIQQHTAGYKHCILCVTVWYGKPKLFSTIVHTNWFNDFARPPAHLKVYTGWLVTINVSFSYKFIWYFQTLNR